MELTRELAYRFPLVRGDDVRAVQLALTSLGIEPPCGDADGIYGEQTSKAVRKFQQGFNVGRGGATALEQDGVVGQHTWAALTGLAVQSRGVAPPAPPVSTAVPAPRPPGAAKPIVGALKARVPNDARSQTLLAKGWLSSNFGPEIAQSVAGTPFDSDLVCAIAAKETSIKWLPWISELRPEDVLARSVFDASGDMPGTQRNPFPTNAEAFRARFGDAITQELIDEANQTRALQGWGPQPWLYKGYGIYQYDLQHFPDDETWFRNKEWRTMAGCLSRLLRELTDKHRASGGNLRETVRRYNGRGDKAEAYAQDVMQRYDWCRQ